MNKMITNLSLSISTLMLAPAQAAVTLYDNDGMTFTTDGLVNAFYASSSIETTDNTGIVTERDQSRVRMGFLPNNIGFNFSNQLSNFKVGVRSSFWVSINDTDQNRDASAKDLGTGTLIDIRQFYGTITSNWGEVLVGKDFGLFNRQNILGDELLLGFGQTSDFFGLVDGGNVSFGNISTGYTYPFPKAQITYRSPEINGFKLAIGIMDPNKIAADASEETPRIETELIYGYEISKNSNIKAWVSSVNQSSETASTKQDQSGFGFGVKLKLHDFTFTASGFDAEGLGHVAGLDQIIGSEEIDSSGFLVQGAYTLDKNRFILTYGETEVENTVSVLDAEHSNTGFAWFRTLDSGVTFVVEYNQTEVDVYNSKQAEENNTLAVGAVFTF